MYRWNIKIILNNGKEIVGISDTDKNKSDDVFKELMGANPWREGVYSTIKNTDNTGSIFIKTSMIDSIEIEPGVKED